LEFGLNGHLFQRDFTTYSDIISPSWMQETWRFLVKQDICVHDDLPPFVYMRAHDHHLMDGFSALGLSKTDLSKVNVCRMHLQVLTVADITDGKGVERMERYPSVATFRLVHVGFQPRPPETFWLVWQKAISHLCTRNRCLVQSLGQWTDDGCQHWIWWYDVPTESLF
jgi:hypothetical protein